ncbi:MazG-like family protein [Bacillus cytotoxicus]|uniref:MazG-like family protein n=1 Tax=Bacillus cereus group sp. BfR-BA-01492 TaxID=2920361 RepID=UPI001F56718F|nr:MazG-like family protein [Bacillus cereus group sp. BfR-BA-01492]EMA6343939.1 MazG-like family protein [Bacillus cytotoxicus]
MDTLLKKIKLLSKQEPKTLEQMVLKLTEEVGETSQAVLSYLKVNGSEYKKLEINDVKEECIDVILVSLALFYKLTEDEHELQELMEKKMKKWENGMR